MQDGIAMLGVAGYVEFNQIDQNRVLVGPSGIATVIRDNSLSSIRVEAGSEVIVDNVCSGSGITVATSFLVFIPPETAPHGNYQCPIQQEP
jgi:hypothetical protein